MIWLELDVQKIIIIRCIYISIYLFNIPWRYCIWMYIFYFKQTQLFSCWAAGWLGKREAAYCWACKRSKQRERKTLVLSLCFLALTLSSRTKLWYWLRDTGTYNFPPVMGSKESQNRAQTHIYAYSLYDFDNAAKKTILGTSVHWNSSENSCKNFLLRLARFGWIVSLAPAARECACKAIKYPLL